MDKYNKINLEISEYGLISIAANLQDSAICFIHFGELTFGNFQKTPLLKEAENQISEYFKGNLKKFKLPLTYSGTKFQSDVWYALRKIPYGNVISYKQLAENSGYPKAFRAVGMANNKNPLPIVIPCHRVVNQNREFGGFAPGLSYKLKLFDVEKIEYNNNKINNNSFLE